MKSLLFDKPQNSILQFIRYIFVGGFAAVLDTGSLYILKTKLQVNYLIAAATGFMIGLIANYFISVVWVFESSGETKREFFLFTVIGAGGLILTEIILWFSVEFFSLSLIFAKIIAIALVLFWNFGMRKKFVFSEA